MSLQAGHEGHVAVVVHTPAGAVPFTRRVRVLDPVPDQAPGVVRVEYVDAKADGMGRYGFEREAGIR